MHDCAVCLQAKCLLLFPCAHPICGSCAAGLSACPTCRRPGTAAAPHRSLQALSELAHCRRCSARYGEEAMPTLLLPAAC